jgi:uncharacterized protein YcfJ
MNVGKRVTGFFGAAALLLSGGAGADHERHDSVHYDYAQVVDVVPISRIVEVSHPHRQCWDQEVRHRAQSQQGPHLGGIIIGGVVGGVVGNRFGKGNGNKAMTAAGTIIGAAVGNEMAQDRHPPQTYTTVEQRCETTRSRHTEERIIGYDVRYRYNGQEFVTRTEHDPGPRLKVRVAVTPVL